MVLILMDSASVILRVLWQLSLWLPKTTQRFAWCMMRAAWPENQPEPYSTLTAGPRVTMATETYGKTCHAGPLKARGCLSACGRSVAG